MYGKADCPVCFGDGGWEDPIAQQSVICYLCHPGAYKKVAAEAKKADPAPFQRWLKNFPRLPCKYHGPKFAAPPWLFVMHCGATSGSVAEFMHNIGYWKKKSTGKKVYVSAHFNWSNRLGQLTQGVPLDTVGWHVGGSAIEYERLRLAWPESPAGSRLRKLNFCSVGLEMAGPAGRKFKVGEHNRVKELVIKLRKMNPNLRVATRHMDICPTKKDPGRSFDMDIFKECGMVVYG
jgi:hypothetical protein